jgi:hypothetical protein
LRAAEDADAIPLVLFVFLHPNPNINYAGVRLGMGMGASTCFIAGWRATSCIFRKGWPMEEEMGEGKLDFDGKHLFRAFSVGNG